MNSVLENLLETHAYGVFSGLQKALDTPVLNFKRDLYPSLAALDSEIPGIGMQYATWEEGTPHYPFSMEFDSVVRPLRYVPYYLAGMRRLGMIARDVVQESGAHLESCLKELCQVNGLTSGRYNHASLGVLARNREVRETTFPSCGGISPMSPSISSSLSRPSACPRQRRSQPSSQPLL